MYYEYYARAYIMYERSMHNMHTSYWLVVGHTCWICFLQIAGVEEPEIERARDRVGRVGSPPHPPLRRFRANAMLTSDVFILIIIYIIVSYCGRDASPLGSYQ